MDLEKGKRKTETGKHEWYGELRVGGQGHAGSRCTA